MCVGDEVRSLLRGDARGSDDGETRQQPHHSERTHEHSRREPHARGGARNGSVCGRTATLRRNVAYGLGSTVIAILRLSLNITMGYYRRNSDRSSRLSIWTAVAIQRAPVAPARGPNGSNGDEAHLAAARSGSQGPS